MRTLKSVVASKKKNPPTFTDSVWDHNKTYFFNNAFWTIVLKNVYFNIYLLHDLYIFVIYNWINFICCEIKSVGFGVIILNAAQEIIAETVSQIIDPVFIGFWFVK